jgi:hypothetical protein
MPISTSPSTRKARRPPSWPSGHHRRNRWPSGAR